MKELVFATQNSHKLEEIQRQLTGEIRLLSLKDLAYTVELEETQATLEGNAWQKARFIHQRFSKNCFADDTGLEVESLDGAPGVHSAYFSGSRDAKENMQKVLDLLESKKNRKAQFRTVIALIYQGFEYLFEGICKGEITLEARGEAGFGYDPIFKAQGYELTFAEMELEEKNRISHRGEAVRKLVEFLNVSG